MSTPRWYPTPSPLAGIDFSAPVWIINDAPYETLLEAGRDHRWRPLKLPSLPPPVGPPTLVLLFAIAAAEWAALGGVLWLLGAWR